MSRAAHASILLLVLFAVPAHAEWGSISGRFVYDGKVPEPRRIEINKDRDALGQYVMDESLLVNKRNRGIANVIIYLAPKRGAGELRVHPSYTMSAKETVTLNLRGGRFQPHVLLMRTTQKMAQVNHDPIAYNAKIDFFKNLPM